MRKWYAIGGKWIHFFQHKKWNLVKNDNTMEDGPSTIKSLTKTWDWLVNACYL